MKHHIIIGFMSLLGMSVSAAGPQRFAPHTAMMIDGSSAPADSVVNVYISVDRPTLDLNDIASLGGKIGIDAGDVVTARIPLSALQSLASVPGVVYVQSATPAKQMLDIAREETGFAAVQSGAVESRPYTGSGVVVGIVDSGFDYGHAAFRDGQGDLRIKRVWEQNPSTSVNATAPEKFGYGVEFTSAAEILSAGGDIRNNSHGTHVASIAAGSDTYRDGVLKGAAPDAEIVLVSMTQAGMANVNISDAIAYIFDYADEVGKPCVVNLSLGANSGPHDGTSTFDVIADRLQGPGRLIVGASGNHREESYHVNRVFSDENDEALRTFIDFKRKISDDGKVGEIELWAEQGMEFEASLVVYKLSPINEAERVVVYPSENIAQVELGRNVVGTVDVASEISPLNGKAHVVFKPSVTSVRTGYAIAIEVTPKSVGTVDIWADDDFLGLTSKDLEGFQTPNGSTLTEIGGTAKRILTVGAYTTRAEYTVIGSDEMQHLQETVGDLSSFSNCGPTADGRIKPQITAPGCFISAAVSNYDNSGLLIYSDYHKANDRDNYYGYMQGTSMASPMVAGMVASWLEIYPDMTPEDLAEIIAVTARTDEFTGMEGLPSNQWGFGKIDDIGAIRECMRRIGSISDVSLSGSGMTKILGCYDGHISLCFIKDMQDVNVVVYDITGRRVAEEKFSKANAGEIYAIDCPGNAVGVCVISITSKSGTETFKFAVK